MTADIKPGTHRGNLPQECSVSVPHLVIAGGLEVADEAEGLIGA